MAMKWEPFPFEGPYLDSNPVKPLMCNFCGFAAGSSLEYQNHTLTHMSSTQDVAGERKNKQGVEKKPKLEKVDAKPHPCVSCFAMFSSGAALKKHVKELHGEVQIPVKKPTRTKLDVMKGVSSIDFLAELQKPKKMAKKEEARCPVCQAVVKSLKQLNTHICVQPSWNLPFGNSNPFFPFTCTLCDYSASTQGDLDNHVRSHSVTLSENIFTAGNTETAVAKRKQEEEEKSFKCPFSCGYSGARDDLLKAHLERKHGAQSGSKSFKPDYALPKAVLPPKPSKKIISQQGKQGKASPLIEEKEYKCGMCDYAGAKKENLKSHLQRVHGATAKKSERKGEDKNTGQTVVTLSSGMGTGVAVKVKVGNGGKPRKKQ